MFTTFVMSAAKRWSAVPLTHAQIIKKLTNKCSAAERAVKDKLYTVPTLAFCSRSRREIARVGVAREREYFASLFMQLFWF